MSHVVKGFISTISNHQSLFNIRTVNHFHKGSMFIPAKCDICIVPVIQVIHGIQMQKVIRRLPVASREECIAHEACDSCGYGSVEIKEISRERALEILNEEIRDAIEDEHWDDQYLNLSDPEVYQKFFDSEVDFLIKWKEPGWQLLKEEYRS